MSTPALCGITFLTSYLVGAIPFGYLVARWHGVDIFQHGSGNIGATNVGRVLGWWFGILVFLLDFAKGALPAAVALALAPRLEGSLPPPLLPVAAGLAAILGHLFPVYLRFRGGKGVATGAGVVAVLLPGPLLGALLVWLTVATAWRYVSLASLAAAVALCGFRFGLTPRPFAPENQILTLFCLLAAALVLVRHRGNLTRLLHGSENRLAENPAMFALSKILHILALGLWFGMTVFFSFIVALTLFQTFESIAAQPHDARPIWFPVAATFDTDAETRREQGTRAAGAAVSPLFDWFFLLQGVCGLVAVVTALGWSRAEPAVAVHRWRSIVLLLALGTVVAGWPIERHVSHLRMVRNETRDAMLTSPKPVPESVLNAADEARVAFGRWHFYSLILNFVTVLLVAIAMALAAFLPTGERMKR